MGFGIFFRTLGFSFNHLHSVHTINFAVGAEGESNAVFLKFTSAATTQKVKVFYCFMCKYEFREVHDDGDYTSAALGSGFSVIMIVSRTIH